MTISIGSDHAGFCLKQDVIKYLQGKNINVLDKGCYSEERADYPDHGHAVANSVLSKECDLGIVICGSGNGINMSVNKHKGIRGALCWNHEVAALARQHNDANIMALPARYISNEEAFACADAFLSATFEGGRHAGRVRKNRKLLNTKTMIKKIICILFMAFTINASAQITALEAKGLNFPQIYGQTLADKYIELPIKNGKKTVVGIAYSRAAEDDLKKWLNPLYNTFMVKEGGGTKNFDVAEIYDVNFVFIPVIAGLKNVITDFKASTDKEFWPYIMDTQKTDIKKLKETLKAKDEKIPYFYVLEDSGKIIEMVSGAFKEDKMDKLEAAAE